MGGPVTVAVVFDPGTTAVLPRLPVEHRTTLVEVIAPQDLRPRIV